MASAGADWATNPVTQIRWGLGYIQDRYGRPCGAWGHSQATAGTDPIGSDVIRSERYGARTV